MRKFVMLGAIAGGLVLAAPVDAQNSGQGQAMSLDARVSQVEKRLNTVERVISRQTGGTPMVQPDIGPPDGSVSPAGTPATAPLADLQARVAGVEGEVNGLTNRVETAEHRLQLLEADFAAYRKATDARLRALEDGRASAEPPAAVSDGPAPTRPTRPAATAPKPAPAADTGRADRVAAVPKPTGADAADKGTYAYNYGYRLWKAGLYPEAETQLDTYATRFPRHRLVSRAQNVLGLIYLDDGKPKEAAEIFYANYSKLPDGERAPDSLLNLARALTALKRPAPDLCQVYKEFGDVYGDKASAAQKAEVDKGRATYKCK